MWRISRSPLGPYFNSSWRCGTGLASTSRQSQMKPLRFKTSATPALHLRRRQFDGRAFHPHRIADPGEHVGDWIGHHECWSLTTWPCERPGCSPDQRASGNRCDTCRTCDTRPADGRTACSDAPSAWKISAVAWRLRSWIYLPLPVSWADPLWGRFTPFSTIVRCRYAAAPSSPSFFKGIPMARKIHGRRHRCEPW